MIYYQSKKDKTRIYALAENELSKHWINETVAEITEEAAKQIISEVQEISMEKDSAS